VTREKRPNSAGAVRRIALSQRIAMTLNRATRWTH
jgi:hypothetical protein